jgi:hypothetical protein
MSSLVAENDERPSSSNMTQLDRSTAAVESHNAFSPELAAETSTQTVAQPDTRHTENDTAPISEAARTPTSVRYVWWARIPTASLPKRAGSWTTPPPTRQ